MQYQRTIRANVSETLENRVHDIARFVLKLLFELTKQQNAMLAYEHAKTSSKVDCVNPR